MTKVHSKLEMLAVRREWDAELLELCPLMHRPTGATVDVRMMTTAIHRNNDANDYSLSLWFENSAAQQAFETNFAALSPDAPLVQAMRDVPIVKRITATSGAFHSAAKGPQG